MGMLNCSLVCSGDTLSIGSRGADVHSKSSHTWGSLGYFTYFLAEGWMSLHKATSVS